MATINGVTFNMVSLRPVAVHRNSISEQPGSDTNFITDMGYDGLVLRLDGFEETLATYDSVISEFMKSGEQTLIHRTGWQFKVYSVQLTPELIRGFADNYFPYDLILYTSTPYRESTTLSCRAKEITANNQEWSAEDMPCNNLLDNWSFEDWSAGPTSPPDYWSVGGTGTESREPTTIKVGTYSCKLISDAALQVYLYNTNNADLDFYTQYVGESVSFGGWVWCDTGSKVKLRAYDGVSDTDSSYHSGSSSWEYLSLTKTIASSANRLRATLVVSPGTITAYFDGMVLVEGDSIPDNTFIRDIDTDGSVDAVPDIQVTSIGQATFDEIANYDVGGVAGPPTGMTWDGSNMWICDTNNNKIHKLNSDMSVNTSYNSPSINPTGLAWDGSNMWSCDAWLDKIYKHDAAMAVLNTYDSPANVIFGLTWDGSNIWSCDSDTAKIYKHDTDIITILGTYDSGGSAPQGLTWDGSNIWSCDVDTDKIYKHDAAMAVIATRTAPTLQGTGLAWISPHIYQCSLSPEKIYKLLGTFDNLIDVDIYNTSNSSIKCSVANSMLTNAIHQINADGTGTISYSDDFSADIYQFDSTNLNCTTDTINDELDIADDGYIYWKMDTKYPLTGIPTLTSRINITTGTPTIQIAADSGGSPDTWYDIDTAIVDDVNTVYELDDSTNLSLKGSTIFYWRIDCVKAGAATCSIKSFELDINIVTIDAEHPLITTGGSASTLRCDQGAASGMNCIVALIYRDRSWPA